MSDNYANPRIIALKTLYEIEKNDAYSNIALKKALANPQIKPQDKAFIANLVYGSVKYKLRLDYIIAKFSDVKLKKLSDFVLLILRMGVYQLVFMDKVPTSAAVDESVKLANKYAVRSKGLINAVLRKIAAEKDNISYPRDRAEYMSVYYSYPRELVDMWIGELGADACEQLLISMNTPPPITVRVNTRKTSCGECMSAILECGAKAEPGIVEDSLVISGGDIANVRGYVEGHFTPQGLSSMLAARVLAPQDSALAMDVCAAPGGKSTHIAQLMNSGEVVAFDIFEHKIELINQNAQRMGFDNIHAAVHDASVADERYIGKADKVLVDAPCSGLGIIRKKADIKWGFGREKIDELSKMQLAILTASAEYVKPSGELVYSTCTISNAENIGVCRAFLERNTDFEPVDITSLLPKVLQKETAKDGYIQIYPHVDNMDGFFIFKMRRK